MNRIGLTVAALLACAGSAALATPNGITTVMPAFYDDQLFNINFTELVASENKLLAHNGSLNVIYMSDGCMPGGQMFVSVIDAIQGDGFNPLWQEVQVVFDNPAFPCQQLTSDTDILAAAADNSMCPGSVLSSCVTLQPTTEVYRCSVIGAPL
jgi:hypothetical protein